MRAGRGARPELLPRPGAQSSIPVASGAERRGPPEPSPRPAPVAVTPPAYGDPGHHFPLEYPFGR